MFCFKTVVFIVVSVFYSCGGDTSASFLSSKATKRTTTSSSSSSTQRINAVNFLAQDEVHNPRFFIGRGMDAFRNGDISGSIEFFDRAEQVEPKITPFLWQRGISYYYADQFRQGSTQFRTDVRVNPLDVEEIVWDIACLSRLDPTNIPPPSMMSLPKGQKDRRRIMSTVYSLFRGDIPEHDLAIAGHQGSLSDEFYALFYLGLFCESKGEITKAENYMKAAVTTKYAQDVGYKDYMTACARVHCELRGWM